MQLVLNINNQYSSPEDELTFRWYWLAGDLAQVNRQGIGSLSQLAEDLRALVQDKSRVQAWLLLPGEKIAMRRLNYSDKEKKYLRTLLPYQLEDVVVDNIDELHFALSPAENGEVTLAFSKKKWIENIFAELQGIGIDVSRCFSAPALLPMAKHAEAIQAWSLGLFDDQLWVRVDKYDAFSVSEQQASFVLTLLEKQIDIERTLHLELYAESPEGLERLRNLLSEEKLAAVQLQEVRESWQLDYNGDSIDLCQGELAQKLPLDRWWRLWKTVAIVFAVGMGLYVAVSLLAIQQLQKQNSLLAQSIEAEARKVIPQGRLVNVERQVAALVQNGSAQTNITVIELFGFALPIIAEFPSLEIKGIAFSQENGELNINLQASSFSIFDQVASKIKEQGYEAEILSANAQGNVQTARLKIKK